VGLLKHLRCVTAREVGEQPEGNKSLTPDAEAAEEAGALGREAGHLVAPAGGRVGGGEVERDQRDLVG
jgi:hypothetical protein